MPALGEWLIYTFLTTTLWSHAAYGAAKDNTTCASSQLAWYTDAVKETPCECHPDLFRPDLADHCPRHYLSAFEADLQQRL